MKHIKLIFTALSALIITGCSAGNTSISNISDNSFSIGAAFSFENYNDTYYRAYEMAAEDIEKLDSPVDINVKISYDMADYTTGLKAAQDFCSDDTIVGVVGHINTDMCLSLKNIYEENQIPLIVPTIDSNKLLDSGEKYIYRTMPNMTTSSEFLTALAYIHENIENVVIIYSDGQYGNEFSKVLEQSLVEDKSVTVADKVCAPDVYKDMPDCIKKWKALDADTVFLIGNLELYQYYVPLVKEFNPDMNIYSSVDFENYYLDDREVYPYYENVYQLAQSQYDYNDELKSFYERYQQKYGSVPNSDAVQIYDDIMIIAKAIAENNVRSPQQLKNFLDSAEDIGSIYGDDLYFSENEVRNKMNFIQSYNEDGSLSYSIGLTNDELDEVWLNYYSSDVINELAFMGDYSDEK